MYFFYLVPHRFGGVGKDAPIQTLQLATPALSIAEIAGAAVGDKAFIRMGKSGAPIAIPGAVVHNNDTELLIMAWLVGDPVCST